ncbi:MAG TPA: tetratricopeptide repeat protein [Chloroflexota bacterium]|nr:tetratricopeptide repeat protein [Chloroflexota bacterium]
MGTAESERLGDLIRRYRLAAGFTQEELAERAALSLRAVGDLERGVHRAPRRETIELLAQALGLSAEERGAIEILTDRARRPGPVASPRSVLPPQPTSFLGREQELGELADLMQDPGVRLLTLLGPGGVGKTRLAIEGARALQGDFGDGVVFVPLASVRTASLVVPTLIHALGVEEGARTAGGEAVIGALRNRNVLLLLDNLEHVLDATALIARVLHECEGVKILATSRTVLRLAAEHTYTVPTMQVPGAEVASDLSVLETVPAVRLFVERARAAKSDFVLTAENAEAIAEVCRRLDGLPLAIELAAARSRVLTPTVLLSRLSSRLDLLRGGATDVPARQQTVREAIDWSYQLLEPPQQQLFAELAVFEGGATLDAIEAICLPGAPVDAVDLVGSLLDQSLISMESATEGAPRYQMLDTIRAFAHEHLERSSKAEQLRARHARYFLSLAGEAEDGLLGENQQHWMDDLDTEQPNLRAALSYMLAAGDAPGALQLAGALGQFWVVRGYLDEGRVWLEAALAAGDADAATRAKATQFAGTLAYEQGNLDDAERFYLAARQLYLDLGDVRGLAAVATGLGNVAWERADFETARTLFESSLNLHQQVGDDIGAAAALNNLGNVACDEENLTDAERFYQRALELYRDRRNRRGAAVVLNNLGAVLEEQGDQDQARDRYEESLELSRQVGDQDLTAALLLNLGDLALLDGKLGRATALYEECLRLADSLGAKGRIASVLERFAAVSAAGGEYERAGRLFGAADDTRERMQIPWVGTDRRRLEPFVAAGRKGAGEGVWQGAVRAGRSMPLSEAVAYALARETASSHDPGPIGADR